MFEKLAIIISEIDPSGKDLNKFFITFSERKSEENKNKKYENLSLDTLKINYM